MASHPTRSGNNGISSGSAAYSQDPTSTHKFILIVICILCVVFITIDSEADHLHRYVIPSISFSGSGSGSDGTITIKEKRISRKNCPHTRQ